MSERPQFEDFRFKNRTLNGDEINPDLVDRIVEGRLTQDVPSLAGKQRLNVYTTTPDVVVSPDIVVRATAFSDDNGRPEGAVFDALVAEATGRRVMAVNAPGIDFWLPDDVRNSGLHELTEDQFERLKEGSFRSVGEASMRAAILAAHMQGIEPEFVLSASSMGVATTAGMLHEATERSTIIRGVVLAEPVNHMRRSLPRLGTQFVSSGSKAKSYMKMNPESLASLDEGQAFWIKRVLKDRVANLAYAKAMAKGTFFEDLGSDALERLADERIPVYLTRGTASKLSGGDRFEDFVLRFSENDSMRADRFDGHDHPYTMTVQSLIDGVEKVSET